MNKIIIKEETGKNAALSLKAHAKINLALDVLGKRQVDNYHEVAMIMQSVDLFDTITLENASRDICLSVDNPALAADQTNLAYRAAILLKKYCRLDRGVKISIKKKIPIAAGLAGGSADAAATLLGLARLWELPLDLRELSRLGAILGSDVSFCLYGGTMLATGRGEIVAPLPALPKCYAVLAKLPLNISTAWVYGKFRAGDVKATQRPNIAAMSACLEKGDLKGVAGQVSNVLETVTVKEYPQIALLKDRMLEYGAMAALMSGSGPTVFGLVKEKKEAQAILERFQSQDDIECELYVAETVDSYGA